MNLHGVLNRGQGRRFLAAGAVAALGLAIGAAPSMACVNGDVVLTLVKSVNNDAGGSALAAAWTLDAVGTTGGLTDFAAGQNGVNHPVLNGTYTLSESPATTANYTSLGWKCDNSVGYVTTVTINNVANANVTCTITNTYVPHTALLTLVKVVNNDAGGSAQKTDWTLDATGGPTSFDAGTSGVNHQVLDGTYTLSESPATTANYSASTWKCTRSEVLDKAVASVSSDTVVIGPDDTAVTCTITNTFVPPPPHTALLTLVKVVNKDAGGFALATDWTLDAVGTTDFAAGQSGVNQMVAEGTYTLSESPATTANYSASSWDCTNTNANGTTVIIGPNDTAVTCTITNAFVPPTITRIIPDVPGRVKPAVVAPPVVTPVAGVVKNAPAATPAPAVKTLAFTGAETVPLGLSGLIALVLGAVLTVASRRQRPKQARE